MSRRTYRCIVNERVHVQAFSDREALHVFQARYAGIRLDVMQVLGRDGEWYAVEYANAHPDLFEPTQPELPLFEPQFRKLGFGALASR